MSLIKRKNLLCVAGLALLVAVGTVGASDPVVDLWSGYDPRRESLNPEVIKEWQTDEGTLRLVRYDLGTLNGSNRSASPKIAAYYGFPKGASKDAKVPGIVQIHGGGQRAQRRYVERWTKHGYACISINWGEKNLEGRDLPNTDWDGLAAGFIGKKEGLGHHNEISPTEHTLFSEPHPMNSSWMLIAVSARRALTFLEEQPEVDANRLGVSGHSMGGRATVLTAIDPRVKAATPSVGGSGFLYEDLWGLPGSARNMYSSKELYRETVSSQNYWPHIKAPILFLGATNDFNSPTESVVRGMQLLPEETERMLALAPHLDHRFTSEAGVARTMWMEDHLKGNFSFPRVSKSKLDLNTESHIPRFLVKVDTSSGLPVQDVEIFYGYTRDPRLRFWRSAEVQQNGSIYSADCPVFDTGEPLFAFANITYQLDQTRPGPRLTVTSEYQVALPDALSEAGVVATEKRQRLIDEFAHGMRDWFILNEGHRNRWIYTTRKLVDPSWMGPSEAKLAVELETTEPGNFVKVVAKINSWQAYLGRKRGHFTAKVKLPEKGRNTFTLSPSDFKGGKDKVLNNWDAIAELTFTPAGSWKGSRARMLRMSWEGGSLEDRRPYPHEKREDESTVNPADFEDEFESAIDTSVKQGKNGEWYIFAAGLDKLRKVSRKCHSGMTCTRYLCNAHEQVGPLSCPVSRQNCTAPHFHHGGTTPSYCCGQ